jgi:hypothetical protein
MKRDMELVRTILLKVEADPKFDGTMHPVRSADLGMDAQSGAEIAYNSAQLVEAGFLTGNATRATEGLVMVGKLTWKGHEFVDSVRDPKIWTKTKDGALAAGGFTLDLLKDLAQGFLKKQIEERTGVTL